MLLLVLDHTTSLLKSLSKQKIIFKNYHFSIILTKLTDGKVGQWPCICYSAIVFAVVWYNIHNSQHYTTEMNIRSYCPNRRQTSSQSNGCQISSSCTQTPISSCPKWTSDLIIFHVSTHLLPIFFFRSVFSLCSYYSPRHLYYLISPKSSRFNPRFHLHRYLTFHLCVPYWPISGGVCALKCSLPTSGCRKSSECFPVVRELTTKRA